MLGGNIEDDIGNEAEPVGVVEEEEKGNALSGCPACPGKKRSASDDDSFL